MSSTPPTPIRVLLVEDSLLVREGIKSVLTSAGKKSGIIVVGEAATEAEAIAQNTNLHPHVVLMDIRLGDGSGLAACKAITTQKPSPKVIVLTSHISDALVYEAITSGAEGYLMKEIDPAGLIDAISRAARGASILSPEMTSRVFDLVRGKTPNNDAVKIDSLSHQEQRVLALVSAGLTNKEIGQQLSLSDNTVKNYLGSVFEKLAVKNRSQAASLYTKGKHLP